MARGRRAPRRGIAPARRMARGGRATVARKTTSRRGKQMGGRIMQRGGGISKAYGGHGSVNKQCRNMSGDRFSCNQHPNCTYDPSTEMCN